MRGPNSAWLERFYSAFSICFLITTATHAQRLVLPPDSTTPSQSESQVSPLSTPESSGTHVLKTYPDGTKKIVPLEALNYRDDGAAFGGPPRLSVYTAPTPTSILSEKNPERLSVAPIGIEGQSADLNASVPASPDALAGSTLVAAVDPMGGGGGGADPMGGGGSSAPIDPLAGTPQKTAPPLQTVSGKPAPIVGDTTTLQLGEWESFFLNAGIGGALQGQLTARRVWDGNNRTAYPYVAPASAGPLAGQTISGENFTFNPGFRLDVEFGYNFYEWLGVGLQTGLIYNGINQYNVDISGGASAGSYHCSADGELVQVPIQINGILRWPGDVKLRPFIGGGVGAIWQQLDVNNYYIETLDVQGNYCRSAFQFGWNAQLGVTYTVEPGVDFYGAFKMLSAFMPVIGNYQFENSYNFAVEVGIQSRF
jgi:hypothetical protein